MTFKWLDRRIAAPGPYLTLVRNKADFLKAMKHCKASPIDDWIKTPQADATVHFLSHPDGGRCAIVAIRIDDQPGVEIAGLLVHEAVHIAQDYFEHIGERHPASEQQAYAIQSIAQELMAEYARQITE